MRRWNYKVSTELIVYIDWSDGESGVLRVEGLNT